MQKFKKDYRKNYNFREILIHYTNDLKLDLSRQNNYL